MKLLCFVVVVIFVVFQLSHYCFVVVVIFVVFQRHNLFFIACFVLVLLFYVLFRCFVVIVQIG